MATIEGKFFGPLILLQLGAYEMLKRKGCWKEKPWEGWRHGGFASQREDNVHAFFTIGMST